MDRAEYYTATRIMRKILARFHVLP